MLLINDVVSGVVNGMGGSVISNVVCSVMSSLICSVVCSNHSEDEVVGAAAEAEVRTAAGLKV